MNHSDELTREKATDEECPQNRRRGFTLIELLVVIAIIGLLASIILASLNVARAKARDARRYSDLTQLQLALEMSYDNSNVYPIASAPPDPNWWSVCPSGGSHDITGANGYIPNLAPTYIPVLPTEPSGCTGPGYFKGYIYKSNGTDYKVATDWEAELGTECKLGKKFADTWRTTATLYTFCTIYSGGAAAGW